MIRPVWNIPHRLVADLHLLQALVWGARPAFHAVVGAGSAYEMCAMADAMRRSHRMGFDTKAGESARGRVRVFHRGYGLGETQKYIKRLDKATNSTTRTIAISDVISFVAGGKDYSGWRQTIEQWLPYDKRFGLVVHVGIGKTRWVRRDLIELTPMMDHNTTIVMCGMYRTGAYDRFKLMLNKGWDGVHIGNLGILQMRKGVKQCLKTE